MKIHVLLIAFVLVLPACRRETATNDTGTTPNTTSTSNDISTDTATATHPASPGGTALVPDVNAGTTVLVTIQDGHIAVAAQPIPAGPAILTVENRGTDVHNLYVEGQGISRAAGDSIPAGKSSTVDVLFKPGTYTLYCPILDHRQKGEQATITVQQP